MTVELYPFIIARRPRLDQEPDLKRIYDVLVEGFNKNELLDLCFSLPSFKDFDKNRSGSEAHNEVARSIVDLANRRLLIEDLLDYVKEHDPRRYDIHKPYFKEPRLISTTVTGAISLSYRGEAFILSDNNLGRGISLGGVYQGISLSIVATPYKSRPAAKWDFIWQD
jgi:hypothetical protein